jgi:hypothetical protein
MKFKDRSQTVITACADGKSELNGSSLQWASLICAWHQLVSNEMKLNGAKEVS